MKNNVNYFNNEERNGIFLLCILIVIFSLFIFFQKRVLPSHATVNISINDVLEGERLNSDKYSVAEQSSLSQMHSHSSAGINKNEETRLPSPKVNRVAMPARESSDLQLLVPREISKENGSVKKSVFSNSRELVKQKQKQWKKQWKPKAINAFSLNSENPEDWKQVNGIGEGYSARIIKYKSWLGGFHSVEQLGEVYGLTDSLVQVISPHLIISQDIDKIKINYAESKVLGRHPYVEWKEADILVKYRKHHFPITRESFIALKGISNKTKQRILPYIDFGLEDQQDKDLVMSGTAPVSM